MIHDLFGTNTIQSPYEMVDPTKQLVLYIQPAYQQFSYTFYKPFLNTNSYHIKKNGLCIFTKLTKVIPQAHVYL